MNILAHCLLFTITVHCKSLQG